MEEWIKEANSTFDFDVSLFDPLVSGLLLTSFFFFFVFQTPEDLDDSMSKVAPSSFVGESRSLVVVSSVPLKLLKLNVPPFSSLPVPKFKRSACSSTPAQHPLAPQPPPNSVTTPLASSTQTSTPSSSASSSVRRKPKLQRKPGPTKEEARKRRLDFENGPVFKEMKEREAAIKRKREQEEEEGRTFDLPPVGESPEL